VSAPASPPALSARCLALYGLLRDLAAIGAHTPMIRDLKAELHQLGHQSGKDPNVLYFDIIRLVDAGLIRTHGAARTRVYEVIGVGSTVRRPGKRLSAETLAMLAALRSSRREANEGWPRPTKASGASYDAAVAARAFADGHAAGETWVHSAIRPAASDRSLTGCAAAMSAEGV